MMTELGKKNKKDASFFCSWQRILTSANTHLIFFKTNVINIRGLKRKKKEPNFVEKRQENTFRRK